MVYPEAEIVVPPAVTVLLHRAGGGAVPQVMVPTDKHQWDGGICSLQRCLQVALLPLFVRAAWKGQRCSTKIKKKKINTEKCVLLNAKEQNNKTRCAPKELLKCLTGYRHGYGCVQLHFNYLTSAVCSVIGSSVWS